MLHFGLGKSRSSDTCMILSVAVRRFIKLSLPKLLNQFMDRRASYQKWAASVSISSPIQQRRVLYKILWFLTEGSRSRALWSSMVVYLLCLIRLPWFWGHVTSENGDIAPMYMFGWRVNSSHTINPMRLGNPDVLTITLPFMYFTVTPLLLLIYWLYAERSAACFRSSCRPLEDKTTSRRRVLLLLACMVIACIHSKQCFSVMLAYGVATVAMSPVFTWGAPLLMAAAIYSTSALS